MIGRVLPRVTLAEVPSLAEALIAAVVVEFGLHTTTLPRLARALGAPLSVDGFGVYDVGRRNTFALPRTSRERLRAARRVVRRWPFGNTCLRHALVSGRLLRDLEPALQIGVARIDGQVRAHAWLVVDGVVIDPLLAVESYQPLVSVWTQEP